MSTLEHNPNPVQNCDECGRRVEWSELDRRDHGTESETGYQDVEYLCECCAAARDGRMCYCEDCEGARVDAAYERGRDEAGDMAYRESIGD